MQLENFQSITSDYINHEMHEQSSYGSYSTNVRHRCFHSNFRVAISNLFMYLSLTNKKRDILLSA